MRGYSRFCGGQRVFPTGLLLFDSLHRCGKRLCAGVGSTTSSLPYRCTLFADTLITPPVPPFIGRVMRLPFTLSADCAYTPSVWCPDERLRRYEQRSGFSGLSGKPNLDISEPSRSICAMRQHPQRAGALATSALLLFYESRDSV